MKIRNGFVSNSSSSSFLILKNGEMNKEELQKYLFEDRDFFESFYNRDQKTSVKDAMEILFNDVQEPVEKEELEETLGGLLYSWCNSFEMGRFFYNYKSYKEKTLKEIKEFEEIFHIFIDPKELENIDLDAKKGGGYDRIQPLVKELAEKLFNKVYLVEYCDDYGDIEAELEHNVMIKAKHTFRINNH